MLTLFIGLGLPSAVPAPLRFVPVAVLLVSLSRTGRLTPVTNSCNTASSGVILLSGSHLRHRATKSTNASSSHLSACASVLELGLRLRPLLLTVMRGLPMESKNSFFRELFSMRCFSGGLKDLHDAS